MKHEKIKKRLLGVTAVLAVVFIILLASFLYQALSQREGNSLSELGNRKETIHLWYTDDALTDYLNSLSRINNY